MLQKKAVKLVGGGKHFDSTTLFYSKLKIPKLSNLYKIEIPNLYITIFTIIFLQHFPDIFLKHVNTHFEQ